uniref:ANK_REP_REGION domain-containing protein n=1 Tax=Trichuris muris TaxID=70415 RepID=A0A5S6Q6X5_TRIMR
MGTRYRPRRRKRKLIEYNPPADLIRIDPFYLMDEGRIQELLEMFKMEPFRMQSENHNYLTPLMYALVTRKMHVFYWLLEKTAYRFRDTVLTAVMLGDTFNVKLLLDIQSFDEDEMPPKAFPSCMTPLMLAAHCDNHEMVKLLLSRGHKLEMPHRPNCRCKDCKSESNGQVVAVCRKRLLAYRALCSHAYLLQECFPDPVIDAFLIARDLEKCQSSDDAYAEQYKEMAKHVGKIPLALLNTCSNESEVDLMLRQKEGSRVTDCTALPRLSVAMDTKQKEFITSPLCLNALKRQWMGGWNDWDRASWATKQFRLLSHTILYPLTCMIFLLTNGKAAKSYNYPVARFYTFTVSYFTFVVCLIGFTQYKEARNLRGAPDSAVKKAMLAYIWTYMLGLFVVTWTDLLRLGFRRFLFAWWRWYDFIQLLTYLLAFNAFLISTTLVYLHGEPYTHRVHWDPLHPTLIFEVLFTIAAVLSSWRLFYFLQVMRTFGPLVISIGKCVKDILLFWVIFMVVLGSFALGLNYLIEHYKYNVVIRDGKVIEQQPYMTSIQSALRYLYWAWYGYLDPERLEVIVGNCCPHNLEIKHRIIQNTAEFLSALYYIVLVVGLLNLMISIMATTAGAVLENRDMEWKYVRCQIWWEFCEDCRTLPPPFCLLQLLVNGTVFVVRKYKGDKKQRSIWDMNFVGTEEIPSERQKYLDLIRTLRGCLLRHKAMQEMTNMEHFPVTGQSAQLLSFCKADCS